MTACLTITLGPAKRHAFITVHAAHRLIEDRRRRQDYKGAYDLADPRWPERKNPKNYANGGHYGVLPWDASTGAVTGHAKHDNGRFSVADPNLRCTPMIISLDNTWHRPFTTYELALLQGFPSDIELCRDSHTYWRMGIGNAVPPPTAKAIGNEAALTLLLNQNGISYQLTDAPIWVQQLRRAIGVQA